MPYYSHGIVDAGTSKSFVYDPGLRSRRNIRIDVYKRQPQLIADSIDDFFNNLVAFPKIEEEQQTEIIEIEGVMPVSYTHL